MKIFTITTLVQFTEGFELHTKVSKTFEEAQAIAIENRDNFKSSYVFDDESVYEERTSNEGHNFLASIEEGYATFLATIDEMDI